MQQYIARRLILGALTGVLVSLLIFGILRIAPGDVAMMIALSESGGDEIEITDEQLEELREQLGLNVPLPQQYFEWMGGWITGDWGTSLFRQHNVFAQFKAKVLVTLELGVFSLVLSLIISIPLGIMMALKQDTWMDYAGRVFCLLGLSIPNFWIGTLLLVGGMYWFNWNPRLGYVEFVDDPFGNLSQLFWPSIIIGYSAIVVKARMLRSSLLEVLRQDYIRTAHAKGLRGFVVTYRHALKNSLLPVVTVIGISFAGVVGGSVIMERIFSLPGLGNFLVEGMNQRDYPVVQSLVTFFAMWIILVNLLVDISYAWLDPRIRLG